MNKKQVTIYWPNNLITHASEGDDWFLMAKKANLDIPTGCLTGSCGACEIDVNGDTVRPCIHSIKCQDNNFLNVEFTGDPYWKLI